MPVVLQINSVLNTGSTGRIVEQIGKFALSQAWESYIAYGRSSNLSVSNTIKIGSRLGFASHIILSRCMDKHGHGSIKATKELIEQIKAIKPDIVHLHNLHGYYINYEILFGYLSKSEVAVVWTLHDCWAFTGHCSYFSNIKCEKWKVICDKCPKRKNYPRSWFFDRSKKNFLDKKSIYSSISNLTIVPVSDWLGSLVKESILSNFPMRIINNGIDIDVFCPSSDIIATREKYGIKKKFMLLGVATSWSVGKGWDDYGSLNKILPENCIIVLVGLTKKQMEALPEGILGIIRTESVKELAELYSAADIVLNLSYQETFGMTTAEGFACGTPGIVYNSTASPELITPESGIIVDPGNINQLKDAIEVILRKGKDYYASNCRKRAEDMYNSAKQYEKYFKLYEELIQNGEKH